MFSKEASDLTPSVSKNSRKNHFGMALLTLAASLPLMGCDEEEPNSYGRGEFSSRDLARAEMVTWISNKRGAFVKLEDGNLLAIISGFERLRFFRTFSGFAEFGATAGIPVFQIDIDSSGSNYYVEINYLEALAYFNNDWERIYDATRLSYEQSRFSVNPSIVRSVLRPLAEMRGKPAFDTESMLDNLPATLGILSLPYGMKVPVYLQVNPGELLKVVEYNGEVQYFKLEDGYAPFGAKVGSFGYSIGAESSSGNVYTRISPTEAVAYVEGEAGRITKAVYFQSARIPYSTDPKLVAASLHRFLHPRRTTPRWDESAKLPPVPIVATLSLADAQVESNPLPPVSSSSITFKSASLRGDLDVNSKHSHSKGGITPNPPQQERPFEPVARPIVPAQSTPFRTRSASMQRSLTLPQRSRIVPATEDPQATLKEKIRELTRVQKFREAHQLLNQTQNTDGYDRIAIERLRDFIYKSEQSYRLYGSWNP